MAKVGGRCPEGKSVLLRAGIWTMRVGGWPRDKGMGQRVEGKTWERREIEIPPTVVCVGPPLGENA